MQLAHPCVELDLDELKSRAFGHISKSMSVQNVPFELFSGFSAAFGDIRKVSRILLSQLSILRANLGL